MFNSQGIKELSTNIIRKYTETAVFIKKLGFFPENESLRMCYHVLCYKNTIANHDLDISWQIYFGTIQNNT